MLKHLFKLVWARKKNNILISIELFFSFIILFAVITGVIYSISNYNKPLGFNYENVLEAELKWPASSKNDEILDKIDLLKNELNSIGFVDAYSFTEQNTPFDLGNVSTGLVVNNVYQDLSHFITDDQFLTVMGLTLSKGRWFNRSDDVSRLEPVVLNKSFVLNTYNSLDIIDQVIDGKYKVIGIIEDYRRKGDFSDIENEVFFRPDRKRALRKILIKLKNKVTVKEERLLSDLISKIDKNWTVKIDRLSAKRDEANKKSLIPIFVLSIICLFLVINVFLGLFGIISHSIQKRKSEIGLRRAIGANEKDISRQIVYEVLLLITISIILGFVIVIQAPVLSLFGIQAYIYIISIFLAIFFIYLIGLLCALYPSQKAIKILPSVALQDL